MEIYVLRHGMAEEGHGLPDGERALTAEGIAKLKTVLALARSLGAAPEVVLTSPLRRAIQTGDIAAEILGYRGSFVRTEALEPESSPQAAWQEVVARRNAAKLLLVGHEPLLSAAVAHLLGSPSLQVRMRPATFVAIEIGEFAGPPHGMMKYMLPPA